MANNRADRDAYIIFGVRPIIKLRTIKLCGKEFDILIIENKYDTPYYLVEDFRDREKVVKAQYIYTRVGDSNTDINKGADIN